MVAWVLDEILKLLHPITPFITEELWRVTAAHGENRDHLLALSAWPQHDELEDEKAEAEIGWLIDLVSAIRSVRAEMNVTAATPLVLANAAADTRARATRWAEFIKRLARVSDIGFAEAPPESSVQLVVRGEVAALPLKGVIDFVAESARLEKEMDKVAKDIARIDAKLTNAEFLKRAPEEVVDGEREKREEAEERRLKIIEALERLKGAA
jgi:valyl-tRNA synthetase